MRQVHRAREKIQHDGGRVAARGTTTIDQSRRQEDAMKLRGTTTAPKKTFTIDPQRFQGPRETKVLAPLAAHHRIALTSAILNDMVENPCFERHPITRKLILRSGADLKAWHRVRDIVVDEAGNTFEGILRSDAGVSPFAIRAVMELLGNLRERRTELEEQIAALDAIKAAFDIVLGEEQSA
jgi:hypothetical protein